ncbi:MerR family transcriptional regulator [Faecalispora jeddahensis]|uniref:MerR family transcriptional regulator n=1 Tax=Faecalispora jeddahensis TaxID=1414721 RepID=UPI001899E760|nr:MerR family transcriptional regulator [Faecalispora jeddahensis]
MKQYSTNEICRLCNVSRKQLRYYEECGMLSPVPRFDGNNYRYYTQQHICEIVAIKALKNIDMSLSEMKDIVYGRSIKSIQMPIQKQMEVARYRLEESLFRYEQSAVVYTKLMEGILFLKLYNQQANTHLRYEVVEYLEQNVVSLGYSSTFEDEECLDIDYLPRIQSIAQEVNVMSFASLIYTTYNHFDSQNCSFDNEVHDYKISVPVVDTKTPNPYYDKIPAFHGVTTVHIGTPKDKKLYNTYMGLLYWAKEQGYELENWSIEEWLISPMITNNKDLWMIRVMIPFKGLGHR